MTTLALDFTAIMSAAAAQHLAELAAKDARIAALEAEHAAMADQLDRVWSRCERLTNARDSLKTQVAALESLVSARAVAAEQQAYDDLSGSVLAEEAYAAAAQAEAEEAGPVIDLTGESEGEGSAAPAAEGGAARAKGGRTKVGIMPEGLSHEEQLKWAYDAYSSGLWKKSYCGRVMPKECQGYTAQSKWCLETLYPVFLRIKEKKAKESAARYAARRAAVGGAANA